MNDKCTILWHNRYTQLSRLFLLHGIGNGAYVYVYKMNYQRMVEQMHLHRHRHHYQTKINVYSFRELPESNLSSFSSPAFPLDFLPHSLRIFDCCWLKILIQLVTLRFFLLLFRVLFCLRSRLFTIRFTGMQREKKVNNNNTQQQRATYINIIRRDKMQPKTHLLFV